MGDNVTETRTLRADVAEEVRALLGRRRMSDIALARKIDRSHTYLYRRLSGETAFDVDDLDRIAEALGVNVVDLLPRSQRGDTAHYATASLDAAPGYARWAEHPMIETAVRRPIPTTRTAVMSSTRLADTPYDPSRKTHPTGL
jgi:transcriptional regulator with XRE-family HTH domain